MGKKRCSHGREKRSFAECNPCPHGKLKRNCAECNPCPHGKQKNSCRVCGAARTALLRSKWVKREPESSPEIKHEPEMK